MKECLTKRLIMSLGELYNGKLVVRFAEYMGGELRTLACLLSSSGPLTPSQISEKLGVSRSNTTAILSSLRGKGLIDMQLSPVDRRQFLVELTDSGRILIVEKMSEAENYVDSYVRLVGRENAEKLNEILELTVAVLKKSE